MVNLFEGILLSFIIAFLAYKKGSLSPSGVTAAIILGTLLFYFGGFFFWIILISFFTSSSIISKFKASDRKELNEIHEKGSQRDYIQVLANGGLALLFSFLYFIFQLPIYMVAFATALAAATADTWASEIGVLSKKMPLSIVSFKTIDRGLSGGVSAIGLIASLLGSLFISIIFSIGFILKYSINEFNIKYFIIIALCGFLGSIIDSYLGALIQPKYKCAKCKKIIERHIHHDLPAILISGFKWFTNDVVNFTSGLLATLISIGLLSF